MDKKDLIQALNEVRETLGVPKKSNMEIIRELVTQEVNKKHTTDLNLLLSDPQREFMTANIDKITAFLSTQDGADAFELLMSEFKNFSEKPVEQTIVPEIE